MKSEPGFSMIRDDTRGGGSPVSAANWALDGSGVPVRGGADGCASGTAGVDQRRSADSRAFQETTAIDVMISSFRHVPPSRSVPSSRAET